MDRISQLPDAVQHQILLLLHKQDDTLKSLIYFSLLSKSCYHAWLTYPHLSFTCLEYKYDYKDFIARFDQTLQRVCSNGLNIEGFSVACCLKKPQYDLNRWLECFIGFNVSVIDLKFCCSSNIEVSLSLLSHVSTLGELRLRNCLLKKPQDGGVLRLVSLRKLRLDYIRNRGRMVEEIIGGCPLLEHLEILSCFGVESLCIRGVPKLQSVLIDCNVYKEVFIDAPCLREFYCNQGTSHILILSDVASWSCLTKLCLARQDALETSDKTSLEELLIRFPHLEYLSLRSCYCPKISSLSIQVLHLVHCKFREALLIDCPSLCLFYYQHVHQVPRIHKDCNFSSDCKFDLYLNKWFYIYQEKLSFIHSFLDELRVFFLKTKMSVTCLKVELPRQPWFNEEVGFHKEQVAKMSYPAKLKYLKLKLRRYLEFPFVLLDLLLWICHPDFIVFTFSEMGKDAQKVILGSIRDIVTKTRATTFKCGCCDGQEVHECWHHSLRDVKIDWMGTTRGKDEEVDFECMDLDVISQQVLHGPINLRVRLRLIWN